METLTDPKAAHRAAATAEPGGNGSNGGNAPVLVQDVPLGEVVRSPFNRTVDTKTAAFAELVDSIRIHGVIQPGLARPLPAALDPERKPGTPRLELVIGKHRWLGSEKAKRPTMPLIVRQLTDVEVVELQTIENDKRQDLNPLEEAEKYQQLIDQYEKGGLKKEAAVAKLCEKLSKGKSTVYEALRLLDLPAEVKSAVKSGKLPTSHAGLIAKLPAEFQPQYARAIAPGKSLSPKEEREIEDLVGWFDTRDDATGLVPFRDAKEVIDSALADIEKAKAYEKSATEFRNKGGKALTLFESRSAKDDGYVAGADYLGEFSSYVRDLVKGRKELPMLVMRPHRHDPAKPEMVYRRAELVAALKKAGVKPKSQVVGTSNADYMRRERERQARQRIAKAALKAAVEPIREAASKRNAKIPWPLFIVAMAGWTAGRICERRGWKAKYNEAGKVLAEHLTKMPENQMPGLVADILLDKVTTEHTGSYQPEFVQLGTFYGVDVKAIAKMVRDRLTPPEPAKEKKVTQKAAKPPSHKATAGQGKANVQTSGTAATKAPAVKTATKKTKTGLTAAARKKLTEAMKARWAARRKAAGGKKS